MLCILLESLGFPSIVTGDYRLYNLIRPYPHSEDSRPWSQAAHGQAPFGQLWPVDDLGRVIVLLCTSHPFHVMGENNGRQFSYNRNVCLLGRQKTDCLTHDVSVEKSSRAARTPAGLAFSV